MWEQEHMWTVECVVKGKKNQILAKCKMHLREKWDQNRFLSSSSGAVKFGSIAMWQVNIWNWNVLLPLIYALSFGWCTPMTISFIVLRQYSEVSEAFKISQDDTFWIDILSFCWCLSASSHSEWLFSFYFFLPVFCHGDTVGYQKLSRFPTVSLNPSPGQFTAWISICIPPHVFKTVIKLVRMKLGKKISLLTTEYQFLLFNSKIWNKIVYLYILRKWR